MHEFYFPGLEEKCNKANSKIQDLEIEKNQVKKLNNQLQEENAGYVFNILLVTFLQHNLRPCYTKQFFLQLATLRCKL